MDFDTIFNDGLDEVLCLIRDLPSYTPARLKQEEFKITRFEIEYILFRFEDYIKGLPAPDVPLSSSTRVLIYNARNILEGMSIVFNVQIGYIQRLYSNYLKYKERQLVPTPYDRADIMKPKKKTGKTRKLARIPDVIETRDLEVPTIRATLPEPSFFDEAPPASHSSVDGAVLFERDSRLLSSLGDASILPDDLELRFAESLKDMTTRLPSVSVAEIGQPDVPLPVDGQPYQVLDKSSLRMVEQTVDMDFSAVPRTVERPSVEPLQHELEQIIENIGVGVAEVKTKNKRVKYKFRAQPIMTSEKYSKFLERRKGFMDPLKYYAKSHKDLPATGQKDLSIRELFFEPILRNILKKTVKEIPVPVIPLYLRHQPLIQTEPGKIPLFEFPITKQDVQHDEALQKTRTDEDAIEERRTDEDVLRAGLERPSSIMPSVNFQSVDGPEIDEIQNISSLMTALSLDYAPRISMPQHIEEVPLPSILEDVRQASVPLRQDENGGERIYTNGVLMSLDEVFIKVTDLCAEMDTTVIRFIEICDISSSKLEAAKVFVHLLELWQRRLVFLHQDSPHPSDIFVTLSR